MIERGINLAVIQGRIGSEVKLARTAKGSGFLQLSLAYTEVYPVKNDDENAEREWQEKTLWIETRFFGKDAENLAAKVKTGDLICVQGKFWKSSVEDKEGNKNYYNYVLGEKWQLVAAKAVDENNKIDLKEKNVNSEPY